MQSILRFMFVVVPTAALAGAVVVGVSRDRQQPAATADGDLQRDLKLASSTSIELAPAGPALATVSAIEVGAPAAAPVRTLRPKRSSGGARVARARAATVAAAPEPEVADSSDAGAAATTELASAEAEATAEAPADGGVALPRPTAIPVSYPPTTSGDPYDPGPGTVIRGGGGVFGGDPCRVHGRGGRIYGPPIYREPRGGTIADARDRIRTRAGSDDRRPTIRERVRTNDGGSSGGGRRPAINDRVRRRG